MSRRFLWLTAGVLAIALAHPRPCLIDPGLVDDPTPEPIDCPLCAGNVKVHAALLNFLADNALDQIANAATRPFVHA